MAFCCCGAGGTATVSSKNADQLRTLESLGLSRGPSPRLRRTEVQIPVTLNVYSLLESNKRLSKMGMGVFHTGVVVYGIEWGYGEVVENPNASGLFCVPPGQAAGTLYRTIRIGYTTRSPMQVDTILHRMENEWRSSEYHILHHNCNHFAQAFCDLLTTTEKLQVPSWCNRAARVGDRVIPRKLATKVQHMMDDEPPKAVAPTPFCNVNEVPLSVVPREWYLHPSIFQPMRYVGGSRSESLRSHDNVAAAYGSSATPRAAATSSHNGGGSSHYTVEYDIVPPPGYEAPDATTGSLYPALMHREVFVATDENGSISRMTAIEEQQPSVAHSSRVASSRKSRRSHRKTAAAAASSSAASTKPTPGHSPAPPPPLGAAASSTCHDRVTVLPRMRVSASHPPSVVPSASPQMSMLTTTTTETESVLRSDDDSDAAPPHNVPRPEKSVLRRACEAADAAEDTPLLDAASRNASHRTLNTTQAHAHSEGEAGEEDDDDNDDEAFSEKPLYTMRDTSLRSSSLGASTLLNSHHPADAHDCPLLLAPRQAQPVGCITAVLASPTKQPATLVAKEKKQRERPHEDRRSAATATATDTASEAASLHNDAETEDAPKPKSEKEPKSDKEPKTSARKEKVDSSRHSSSKRLTDFSAIAAVPASPDTGSPNGSVGTYDSKKKNPAWVFLLKARGITSGNGDGPKKAKKYLSSPPHSDAASHTDGETTNINNNNIPNLDTVSDTSSIPTSQENSAVPQRRDLSLSRHVNNATPTPTTTTTAATTPKHPVSGGPGATSAVMVAESVSDTGLDARPMKETTTVYTQAATPPSTPHSVSAFESNRESAFRMPYDMLLTEAAVNAANADSALPAPLSDRNTSVSMSEGKRSPGLSGQNTPQHCRVSTTSSPSEMALQPLPRRLSESAVLPAAAAAAAALEPRSPVAVSLPEYKELAATDQRRKADSPPRRSQTLVVTPERAHGAVAGTSAATTTTTGASPAAAHRQARRGSLSSTAMDEMPTPPPERSRTPIPASRRRAGKHADHATSSLLLDAASETMEPPVPRASSLSNSSQMLPHHIQRRSSSHAAGDAGTPMSTERTAHTPMAPFPRRPSLLSRERASSVSGSARPGQLTPDQSKSGFGPHRDLIAELKECPPKSVPTPASSKSNLDEM